MATYVLLHGASSDAWYWHLVVPELQARGHEVVAPYLPSDASHRRTFTSPVPWRHGQTSRRGSCCVARTASFPQSFSGRRFVTDSVSFLTRLRAGIYPRSAIPASLSSGLKCIGLKCIERTCNEHCASLHQSDTGWGHAVARAARRGPAQRLQIWRLGRDIQRDGRGRRGDG